MGSTAFLSAGAVTWVGEGPVLCRDPGPPLHDGVWFIREAERQAAAMNRRAYAVVFLLWALCFASYYALS